MDEAVAVPGTRRTVDPNSDLVDGLLVSRREPGEVLHDPEIIAARCVQIATESTVETVDGTTTTVEARSICVHGDTDGAVGIAQAVRRALECAGGELRPFTGGPA
ncbi:LamB/YcsF family protein [Terrabacter terrae]|uniref:LamB/YcsF family protein n=1 Tax=Terrabacter terrae TaxID=318434 RepID=UPI0031E2C6AC